MYNLQGKVALVTGVGGKYGIGRAIAIRLAEEGADLIVNDIVPVRKGDDDDWAGLPDVVREIEAMGRKALSIVADVSNADDVNEMVQKGIDHFGHIDILVCNAGALAGRDRVPVIELEEADWDRLQNVNVKGTFLCCKAVAPHMIAQRQGGRIITMSSVSGMKGTARFAAYCASKFAVRGFTQVLAQELAPHGITVNAICPSLIETERVSDMAAALAPSGVSATDYREEMLARSTTFNPVGRMGQPADVARTAAYLCSPEADFLTGLSIPVAGGSFMG
ncbi:MAG: 3-oxoacyl-ACP reductase family protein [Chloroflexota bacterium]